MVEPSNDGELTQNDDTSTENIKSKSLFNIDNMSLKKLKYPLIGVTLITIGAWYLKK